jgi:predicted regulator of Ras-like GTPase activity (Roadblock/LC7/MglB family)
MASTVYQAPNSFWSGARLTNLNKRCLVLLKEIEQVPGVRHAVICDLRGSMLVARVSGELTRDTLDTVGSNVVTLLATFAGHSFNSIEFQFENRLMYVRTLGNALIAIVCERGSNLALLRMSLNVAAAAFEADKDLQHNLTLLSN